MEHLATAISLRECFSSFQISSSCVEWPSSHQMRDNGSIDLQLLCWFFALSALTFFFSFFLLKLESKQNEPETQKQMGGFLTKYFSKSFFGGKQEVKLVVLGLDAAGKTTIFYKLKLGDIQTTIPTIGNVYVAFHELISIRNEH